MKKYPNIKRIGHQSNNGVLEADEDVLFVQEKLDGANFRFTLERNIEEEYHQEDRELVFGSRNVVYKNERDIDSNFKHAIEYVRENVNIARLVMMDDEYGPLTFFGEAMHPHTIDYDWENTPSFIGFDIYSEKLDEFCVPNEMKMFFHDIGLETAPHYPLYDVIGQADFEIPDSEFYDGVAEGVVIRNIETQQRAKIRSEEFKEMHKSAGGKNPEEYEPEDGVILAHQFATEARILKMIHKYDDRGEDIGMHIMEDLWRDVFDDIISEEYDTIFLGNHTINTKNFRSEVASKTAEVLQRYLSRPEASVLNEVPG